MKRLSATLLLLGLCIANVGCCCRGPWYGAGNCMGCSNDRYRGDWREGGPGCCESCDCYGNWTGAPAGYAPGRYPSSGYGNQYVGSSGGQMVGQPQWSDDTVQEPTPADTTPVPAPAPRNTRSTQRQYQPSHRARPISYDTPYYTRPGTMR